MDKNLLPSTSILRSIESRSRKQDVKKLVWYAIYVFGTPAVLIMIAATLMYLVPHFQNHSLSSFGNYSILIVKSINLEDSIGRSIHRQ